MAADDVDAEVLAAVEEAVEWFMDRPLNTDEFLDRLCDSPGTTGWDIEQVDTPAVRKIMRHARAIKRDATT